MDEVTIELSTLLKVSVSTYYWPFDYNDCIYEMWKEDLEERTQYWQRYYEKDWKKIYVNQEDFRNVEYDRDVDFWNIKIWIAEMIWNEIDKTVNLEEVFWKYWIKYVWNEFYTPHYYNFDDDSYDICLAYDWDLDWIEFLDKYWLTELVQQYINEVRTPSYDWYMSFEPTNLEEVTRSDYCTIRAILQKEWIFEDLKDAINDVIMDWYVCDVRLENMKDQKYTIKEYTHKDWIVDYKRSTDVEDVNTYDLYFEELA